MDVVERSVYIKNCINEELSILFFTKRDIIFDEVVLIISEL